MIEVTRSPSPISIATPTAFSFLLAHRSTTSILHLQSKPEPPRAAIADRDEHWSQMNDKNEPTGTPTHGYVAINGLRLHYLDFGGVGKPVIFLHGVTSDAWTWLHAVPQLPNRRLIALESRGHGDSQWSGKHDYTTEDLASDVIAFVRSITPGSVDLVGESWGGLVGLSVATQVPDIVDSLTMIDIPPSFPRGAPEIRVHPQSFSSSADVLAFVRDGSPNMEGRLAQALADNGFRPGEDGRLFVKHDEYFVRNRPHRVVDYWQDLQLLRIPVLIVRAQGSTHLSSSVAERMLDVANDGQLVTISDTGHRIATDNPVALKATLKAFLAP